MKPLELISHPLCPFNQRLVITLLMKSQKRGIDFDVTYIDLANIPEWFKEISPRGEMPILRINQDTYLYKATPINEYLNEYFPGNLLSDDETERAHDRYWIEYAGDLLNVLRDIFTIQLVDQFDQHIQKMFGMFDLVENYLESKARYWRNQHHCLVDGAFLPAFSLMFHFDYFKNHAKWKDFPKTYFWINELRSTSYSTESICPNYDAEFNHFFSITNSSFLECIK